MSIDSEGTIAVLKRGRTASLEVPVKLLFRFSQDTPSRRGGTAERFIRIKLSKLQGGVDEGSRHYGDRIGNSAR
jgi:hypothetical protein